MSFEDRIVNGGFETGSLSPWVGVNSSVTSVASHSGFYSALMAGGTANSFIYQFVPVAAGESFEFDVFLAKRGGGISAPITVTVGYYNSFFSFLGFGTIVNIPSGRLPDANAGNWLEVFQTTTPAPSGTTQALVLINKLPQAGSPDILTDDAALVVAASQTQFLWGADTVIWADSSAPGPGDGTPLNPYSSLQAAVTAATSSSLATTYGMRARLVVLIAANSVFDEDVIIPPARHVQLLGLGPWVLGNADLANFNSSVPRNITIQTSQAAENVYLNQGPAFDARPVTVIGTLDNGTSVSTHTNYTDGAIISGDVLFQNTDPVDPFTTIEFQLLNARVQGSIIPDPVDPHQGITNTYLYHSRINIMDNPGGRIQRMIDSESNGVVNVSVYSNIANSSIQGDVTASATTDVPPIGIFDTQFGTITWTGTLNLDPTSNYYFVNSGSVLVGTKTVLFLTS